MTHPSTVIAAYLDGALGLTDGVNLFSERLPDMPTQAVAITTYSGRVGDRLMDNSQIAYEFPRVQVAVRDATPQLAYNLAEQAYRLLGGVANDGSVLSIEPQSMPFLLNRDEKERVVYAFNLEMHIGVI